MSLNRVSSLGIALLGIVLVAAPTSADEPATEGEPGPEELGPILLAEATAGIVGSEASAKRAVDRIGRATDRIAAAARRHAATTNGRETSAARLERTIAREAAAIIGELDVLVADRTKVARELATAAEKLERLGATLGEQVLADAATARRITRRHETELLDLARRIGEDPPDRGELIEQFRARLGPFTLHRLAASVGDLRAGLASLRARHDDLTERVADERRYLRASIELHDDDRRLRAMIDQGKNLAAEAAEAIEAVRRALGAELAGFAAVETGIVALARRADAMIAALRPPEDVEPIVEGLLQAARRRE